MGRVHDQMKENYSKNQKLFYSILKWLKQKNNIKATKQKEQKRTCTNRRSRYNGTLAPTLNT